MNTVGRCTAILTNGIPCRWGTLNRANLCAIHRNRLTPEPMGKDRFVRILGGALSRWEKERDRAWRRYVKALASGHDDKEIAAYITFERYGSYADGLARRLHEVLDE